MRKFPALVALAVLAGALAMVPSVSTAASPRPLAGVAAPPNIVVIMTDDQRPNTLRTMPVVRQQIRALGTDYEGVIPTSTCCPSRSSFLSGNFSHTTGVYSNFEDKHGGWPTFHASGYESKTLATALHAHGYETGLVGKYLNQWNRAPDGFVPPGWDVFRAMDVPNRVQGGGRYYKYNLQGTEPLESFGKRKSDYSTDVLADRAVDFVANVPDTQPLFLMFTPYAPHKPFTPAPRDEGSWNPSHHYRNLAVNERDMSDKPSFLQGLPFVSHHYIDEAQTKTGESLRAVDETVGRLITALGPRMDNTLIVYMSDNGVLWGEHRETDKNKPYRWATDVPLMMRWDGRIAPGASAGMAANVDVTQTILDAAGVPNALDTEGVSMLNGSRSSLVLEAVDSSSRPAYCGVRTDRWLYVEYTDNLGRELYDYRNDPLELNNLARDRAHAGKRKHLKALAKTLCSPVPPDFTWGRGTGT